MRADVSGVLQYREHPLEALPRIFVGHNRQDSTRKFMLKFVSDVMEVSFSGPPGRKRTRANDLKSFQDSPTKAIGEIGLSSVNRD